MSGNFTRGLAYLAGGVVFLIYLVVCPKVTAQQSEADTVGHLNDLEGLKALYKSTNGDNWKNKSNWDTTRVELPSPDNPWHGVKIRGGRVTELDLSENGLAGTLPDELGNLSELKILNLQNNGLSDSIGAWIGDLTALEKLYLQNNNLSGGIPDELGDLSELEVLDISGNRLEGVVPNRLTNLKNLRELRLYNNLLSGSIPQGFIEQLPKLNSLSLKDNSGLSAGVISLTDSTRLKFIDLRETGLCIDQTNMNLGEVSEQIQLFHEDVCLSDKEWTALEELYNSTSGSEWQRCTDGSQWNFDTRLRAESVEKWCGVSVEAGSIRGLELEGKNLKGHLPIEIGSLTKLATLHLGDNRSLRGVIPEEIFQSLLELTEFSAARTQLCVPNTTSGKDWLSKRSDSGIEHCKIASATVSDSPWLVIGIGILGLLGTGTVLFILLTQTSRSKELTPIKNVLDNVKQQLKAVISDLSDLFGNQNDNAKELESKLDNLHTDLTEIGQAVRETDKLDLIEDKLNTVGERLKTVISDLDQISISQNSNAGEFNSKLDNLHTDLAGLIQDIKEADKLDLVEDRLSAVGEQLKTMISGLDQIFRHHDANAGEFNSKLRNLHSNLAKLIQYITSHGEERPKEIVAPSEDTLRAIEGNLQSLISRIDQLPLVPQKDLKTEDLTSTLNHLRNALNERDLEIKRLRQGYDNTIFRKFVTRFARVDQAMEYFLEHSEVSVTSFKQIHSLLKNTLQECDVISFKPEIGHDYRSAFGVTNQPEIEWTSVCEDDYRIADVLESGYIMQGGKEEEVLIPARVSIYRLKT